MAKQNIYDNEIFFDGYKKLRDSEVNANTLFEIPAFFSILPLLHGKKVLDMGCGFGDHCRMLIDAGADQVVGIDISEKMLAVAAKENAAPNISYRLMAMEDIEQLKKSDENFDVITSSLAMHYVEDFSGVVRKVYRLLSDDGVFVFSQENPLCTSYSDAQGTRWTKDASGRKLYWNLSHYGVEGERESTWFVDRVKKYHRTFSAIVNTLIDAGFTIEKMMEPLPSDELLKAHPEYEDLLHKPDFLLIRARKTGK